jgi:hypothetical protein
VDVERIRLGAHTAPNFGSEQVLIPQDQYQTSKNVSANAPGGVVHVAIQPVSSLFLRVS